MGIYGVKTCYIDIQYGVLCNTSIYMLEYAPNDEYENIVNTHMEGTAKCIPTKLRPNIRFHGRHCNILGSKIRPRYMKYTWYIQICRTYENVHKCS